MHQFKCLYLLQQSLKCTHSSRMGLLTETYLQETVSLEAQLQGRVPSAGSSLTP